VAFPKVINPAVPQDSDSPSQGAAYFRQNWQLFVDLFGLPANTAISGPILGMGGNTDGKIATAPVLKSANPFIRVIGQETSGHDYRWYSDGGNLRLQLNTATEAAPTWADLIIQALAASPSNIITLGPLTVAGNETVTGNLTVTGTITGHATGLDALTLAGLLTCNGGFTANTLITANAGLSANSITTGTLTASGQITANGALVTNSTVTCNAGVTTTSLACGPASVTTLTTSGTFTANAPISATQGLTAGGLITANAGISASSLSTGGLTVTGACAIQAGATVSGGALNANAGLSTTSLTTSGAATINANATVTGTLTAGIVNSSGTAQLGALICTIGGVTSKGIILQGATGLQTDGATSGATAFTAGAGSVTVSFSPVQPDANYKVLYTIDFGGGTLVNCQAWSWVEQKGTGSFVVRMSWNTTPAGASGQINWLIYR
jgi:hypothetical protein